MVRLGEWGVLRQRRGRAYFYRIMFFVVKCDRIQPSVGDLADRVRRVVPADDEGHLHPAAFARPQKSAAEDPLRQRVLYVINNFAATHSA